MATIDLTKLSGGLDDIDIRLHLETATPLDKYPAKQHARRVAEHLGVDRGLIYLAGAPTKYLEDSDQFIPFRQRRYFYYLSGVDEPDCHLTYDIEKDILKLYVPDIDPRNTIWFGRGSTVDEAVDKYDVDEASWTSELQRAVKHWMSNRKGKVFILHPDQAVKPGQNQLPRVNSAKLQAAINVARVRKDAHEINLIRKANEISAKAHTNVLANIRRFKNETEVEAAFLDACVAEDAKHQAYSIIAASGENAATLHYVKNDEPLKGRQLMCLDAGAEWQCYASDVTRTFPLSGAWPSMEAKAIYELVESMQSSCIKEMRSGNSYAQLQYQVHEVMIEGLLKLGILHNGSVSQIFEAGTSRAFLPHGLGHHVGLEVHDVSAVPLYMSSTTELPTSVFDPEWCKSPFNPLDVGILEEGMVITVEPGIYFSEFALKTIYLPSPTHSKYINKDVLARYMPVGGVRIEDDILITSTGYENLTTAPKGEAMLRIINGLDVASERPLEQLTENLVDPFPRLSSCRKPATDNIMPRGVSGSLAREAASKPRSTLRFPDKLLEHTSSDPFPPSIPQESSSSSSSALTREVATMPRNALRFPDEFPEAPSSDPFPSSMPQESSSPSSSLLAGFQQSLPPPRPSMPSFTPHQLRQCDCYTMDRKTLRAKRMEG